jgi:hypothetical protein
LVFLCMEADKKGNNKKMIKILKLKPTQKMAISRRFK